MATTARVISKQTAATATTIGEHQSINLTAPSIVKLKAPQAAIKSMARAGDDLVITLMEKEVVATRGNEITARMSPVTADATDTHATVSVPAPNAGETIEVTATSGISARAPVNIGTATTLPLQTGGPDPYPAGTLPMPITTRITSVLDDYGFVTGALQRGALTDDATPTISGTGIPGTVMRLYANDVEVGSATVAGDGTWSVTTSDLSLLGGDGVKMITAQAFDAAGNASPMTDAFPIMLDTTPPQAPMLNPLINNDGDIMIIGAAEPGSTVTATLSDGSKITTLTDDISGAFGVRIPGGARAATGTVTVTATDAAGNTSAPATAHWDSSSISVPSNSITIDATRPDTGASSSDFITSATLSGGEGALTFTGTLGQPLIQSSVFTEFVRVWIFDAAGTGMTEAVATVNGTTWTCTLPGTLPDGAYTVVADILLSPTQTPEFTYSFMGGHSQATQTVVVDTTPPTETVTIDDGFSYTFALDGRGESAYALTGTLSAPLADGSQNGVSAESVQVSLDGGNTWAYATVNGATWTYNMTAIPAGAIEVQARVIDMAGNAGATAHQTLVIDITPPASPMVDLDLWDDVLPITGTISRGGETNDSTPTFSGKAVDANVIQVNVYDRVNGHDTYLGSAPVNPADGAWRFEPPYALSRGNHNFVARPVDAAGNEGPESASWDFVLMGTTPPPPAITSVLDDYGPVTGPLNKGNTTDDATPTISGTGIPGTVMRVYANDVEVGSAIVTGNGAWSVTTSDLSLLGGDGVKNITAKAIDGAGQESPPTGIYPIVLDTTAPAKPDMVAAVDNVGMQTGLIHTGDVTDDSQPVLSGRGESGAKVSIKDNGVEIGTTTVDDQGNWSFTPALLLGEGAHAITTTQTDRAGNTSQESDALHFTVDTSAVIVNIAKVIDDHLPYTGDIANGRATDDDTPTLVGTATPNTLVTITEGSVTLGSVTTDASGNWHLTLPAQSEGVHTYTATAQNAAGTTGVATFTLTIDVTPPAVPEIAFAMDDVGESQGTLTNGAATDDSTPTLHGANATPGDVIRIYDTFNGATTLLGSVTVLPEGRGRWNYTPNTPLLEGAHALQVSAVDPVGNESAKSPAFNLIVDTTPPFAKATIASIEDDTGISATDFITSDPTLLINISVDKPLAVGERVQVSLDNGAHWHDAVQSGNGYQYDARGTPLDGGAYTFKARVIDQANNVGEVTSQMVVIEPGSVPIGIAITAIQDDTGVPGDFITSDQTLVFSGTLSRPLEADQQRVQVSLDGATWHNAVTTGATWVWDNTANALPEGNYTLLARIVDLAGNIGATANQTLVIDTTAPQAPTFTPVTMHDGTIAIIGAAEAGSAITVTFSDGSTGTATAVPPHNNDNIGSFIILSGAHAATGTVTVTATDAAGNTSAPATAQLSNSIPSNSVTIDAISPDTGASSSDFITSATLSGGEGTLTFTGTLGQPLTQNSDFTQSLAVWITDAAGHGITSASATINGTTWTYTQPSTLPDGTYTVTATILLAPTQTPELTFGIDMGKGAQTTRTVVVDTTAPTETVTIDDGFSYTFALDGKGGSAYALTGTLSVPLADGSQHGVSAESLQVSLDGGQTWHDASVSGASWSYSFASLPSFGNFTAQARVVDLAGNAGQVVTQQFGNNSALSLTIDSISPDTGASSSDFITNDSGLIFHGTLGSPLPAGHNLQVSMDGGKSWWVAKYGDYSAHDTQWTFDYSAALTIFNGEKSTTPDGTYAVQARIIDNNGATVSNIATQTVVVDTTPPPAPTLLTFGTPNPDGTVTITGNAEIGSTVTVALPDGSQGMAVTGPNGAFSITVLMPEIAIGAVTVTATDVAGNTSVPVHLQWNSITVDAISPDTGASSSDFITSATLGGGDGTPTFTGTLNQPLIQNSAIRQYVQVQIIDPANDTSVCAGWATVNGVTWTYTPISMLLPDGTYIVRADIFQMPNGATPDYTMGVARVEQTVVLDTTAPAEVVTITSATPTWIDASTWIGTPGHGMVGLPLAGLGATVIGTLSAPLASGDQYGVSRESVQVSLDGGNTWAYAVVNGTTWSYTSTLDYLINLNVNQAQVRVIDLAGNAGQVVTQHFGNNRALSLTIDAITPDTGASSSDFITNDGGLIFHGTLGSPYVAGQVIQVSLDGGTTWNTWNYTEVSGTQWMYRHVGGDSALPDGTYAVQARIIDNNGATVSNIATQTVVVDTTAPAETVTIADGWGYTFALDGRGGGAYALTGTISAELADGSQNGVSAESVQVSLDGGQTWSDATVLGTTVLGTWWSYHFTNLPSSGNFTAQARVVDLAGNTGAVTSQAVSIPKTPPWITGLDLSDDVLPVTGTISRGANTDDSTPTFSGKVLDPSVVQVSVYDLLHNSEYNTNLYAYLGAAPVNPEDGTWRFTPTEPLASGHHNFIAAPTDAAGNVALLPESYSDPWSFTVMMPSPPLVTIDAIWDDVLPGTGAIPNGWLTNDDTPELYGSLTAPLSAGEAVHVFRNSVDIGDAMVDGTNWCFPDILNRLGTYEYTARVVDAAGNWGAPSAPYSIALAHIDRFMRVEITAINDDVAPATGVVPNGGVTDDTTPQIVGTVSDTLEAGERIVVLRDGMMIGTATVTGMTWVYNDSVADGGTYVYSARVQNAAGGLYVESDSYTISLKHSGGPTWIAITAIQDDTGLSASDFITHDQTLVFSGTLSRPLEAGQQVQVSLDGATWHAAVATGTTWAWDNTANALPEGNYTVLARVMDVAGNTGATASQAVVIDTTPPHAVTDLALWDNVGPVTGLIPRGGETDDSAPTLSGKVVDPDTVGVIISYNDDNFLGYTPVNPDGTWRFSQDDPNGGFTTYIGFLSGHFSFTARPVDAAGNIGAASAPWDFTLLGKPISVSLFSTGGNDTFDLTDPARSTLAYKLLGADNTGGNGADTVNGFQVGAYETTPNAARIDLAELLIGYKPVNADGNPARYAGGVATIDAGDNITSYLQTAQHGADTVISIDRDGNGGAYAMAALVTLHGVQTDLATLLANHQLVVV